MRLGFFFLGQELENERGIERESQRQILELELVISQSKCSHLGLPRGRPRSCCERCERFGCEHKISSPRTREETQIPKSLAMDEAQAILLNSLQNSGIYIPSNISSVKDLTPDSLVSICAQFLLLIDDGSSPSFPSSLPSSMADRFKICEDMASAIKALGYKQTLSFNQFLYPSDEDSYDLVRFMVVKLSESSEGREDACIGKNADEPPLDREEAAGDIAKPASNQQNERGAGENKIVAEPEEKAASLQVRLSELRDGVANLQSQEKRLIETRHAKALEVQKLEQDYEVLKAAVDMAFDDQYSAGYFMGQLNEQVESKRRNIAELGSGWNVLKQTPEEKKTGHALSSHILEPGVQEKLDQLKEIGRETEATISEINRRESELSKLQEEFLKLPKLPPRKSYIQRITEITKNSWKQDADIERILKETRELQLESNSIRERLDRTYMVVDEKVFREAKKDAMGRQVYRLLTSIHDSFEQISDKILATDRARREAAEQEAKLAALSSRSIDINKLQSDLDFIRKENEFLEQQLPRD